MKCPKCGSEIKDGHLYCEKCGEEICIVPDYDPALDESLSVNLSNVINEINSESNNISDISSSDTVNLDEFATKELKNELNKEAKKDVTKNSIKISSTLTITAIILLGILFVVVFNASKIFSYDAQYEKAFEMFEQGDFEGSIKKVKHVISIDEENERPKLLLCDNYFELGKYDEALAVLDTLMEKYPNDMNIYERLVKTYEAKGENDAISELIEKSGDESVRYMYGDYIKSSVSFSPAGGSFMKNQYVVLESDYGGDIYYTTDDSEPLGTNGLSASAIRYTEPIEVTDGEVIIKAVCVNKKGIFGDISSEEYIVDFDSPEAPVLVTKPGKYTNPTVIEVKSLSEECYYTVDNSEPTLESNKYEGPIAMYIGTHTLKFANINRKGISSEVVEAEYTLDVVNLVDMGTAKNSLLMYLEATGKDTSNLTYKCEQAYVYNGATYYIINEYKKQKLESDDSEDEADYIDKKTGNIYAVDVLTGLTFRAMLDVGSGKYTLSALN